MIGHFLLVPMVVHHIVYLIPRWYYVSICGESSINARYQIALTTSYLQLEVGSPMQGTCDGCVHYSCEFWWCPLETLNDVNFAVTAAMVQQIFIMVQCDYMYHNHQQIT
jgi:hypothetical protein